MAFRPDMSTIPALTSYLQYKGVWDMDDLYKFMASFFSKNKFKFYELRYIQKKPGPYGHEVYHVWQGKRDVEEYYRFVIDIFLHLYDTQDIEVTMKDGSKKTFTNQIH